MSRFTIMCCIHDRSHSVLLLCNPSVFCFRHRIIVHFAFFNVTCILFLIFFFFLYIICFNQSFFITGVLLHAFFLSGWVFFCGLVVVVSIVDIFLQVLYPAHKIIAITVILGGLKYQFFVLLLFYGKKFWLVLVVVFFVVFLLADTIVFNECMF